MEPPETAHDMPRSKGDTRTATLDSGGVGVIRFGLPKRLYHHTQRILRPYITKYTNRYIHSAPNPPVPTVLSEFRFFAVLGTWMEDDIVESNVRNAFAQGVEKVFLVDNASTDATVARALTAGATLAESFETKAYHEDLRILFMNGVVARESIASGADYVWWLWLDADEFPEGPDGLTIVEYLHTLDQRFRVVGSTFFNHFPSGKPENIEGVHPVDLQPLCAPYRSDRIIPCGLGHYKHPLQRFDREGPFLTSSGGFHWATSGTFDRLYEPEGGIVTHHVQYREEAHTRARLDRVCNPIRNVENHGKGHTEMTRRRASLDAVYSQRWQDVDNLQNRKVQLGVSLERWKGHGKRWYERSPGVTATPDRIAETTSSD